MIITILLKIAVQYSVQAKVTDQKDSETIVFGLRYF